MAKKIMVIDDSASLREAVRAALTDAGYEVLDAADGAEALKKLDGRKVDLMICDVHMPGLDGIDFVKEVKLRSDYRFAPIIMLTTEASETSKQAGQGAGGKAPAGKPLPPEPIPHAGSKLAA